MAELIWILALWLLTLPLAPLALRALRRRHRIARLQPSTYGGIVLVKAPLAPQAVRREVCHG